MIVPYERMYARIGSVAAGLQMKFGHKTIVDYQGPGKEFDPSVEVPELGISVSVSWYGGYVVIKGGDRPIIQTCEYLEQVFSIVRVLVP